MWTDALALEKRAAARSVGRGLGPARQVTALDVMDVYSLKLKNDEPLVPQCVGTSVGTCV